MCSFPKPGWTGQAESVGQPVFVPEGPVGSALWYLELHFQVFRADRHPFMMDRAFLGLLV